VYLLPIIALSVCGRQLYERLSDRKPGFTKRNENNAFYSVVLSTVCGLIVQKPTCQTA